MKACHSVSTALLKSVAEIGTQSAIEIERIQKGFRQLFRIIIVYS
jgi:hypothetical protein